MFQLSRREDAWRLAVEWIQAVFFLLIFARSLIPLVAPRVSSPHLVYYGRAPSDGAPSSFRPWRNALSLRTAPQLLEAPRTPKKALSKRYHDTPCGVPRNRRRQLTELFPPI